MKRFTTGIVAVATAFSLSTGAASAANNASHQDIDLAINSIKFIGAAQNGVSPLQHGSAEASSKMGGDNPGSATAFVNLYGSSWENDFNNKFKAGTTADILWGLGIAVALLGAGALVMQSGLLHLPH